MRVLIVDRGPRVAAAFTHTGDSHAVLCGDLFGEHLSLRVVMLGNGALSRRNDASSFAGIGSCVVLYGAILHRLLYHAACAQAIVEALVEQVRPCS